jgi:hypothetical protein
MSEERAEAFFPLRRRRIHSAMREQQQKRALGFPLLWPQTHPLSVMWGRKRPRHTHAKSSWRPHDRARK